MMHPRLVLLRELLAENGSIWVTIDDNEAHYLKVLMDEVFGGQRSRSTSGSEMLRRSSTFRRRETADLASNSSQRTRRDWSR